MRARAALPVALGVLLIGPSLLAAPAGRFVEVWVRGEGPVADGVAPRARVTRVDLDAIPLRAVQRYDVQYARVGWYQGVPLEDLLRRFRPDGRLDLAILHFANGMAVPLPFRDPQVMVRLEPFIARGHRDAARDRFTTDAFAPIRDAPIATAARPITFAGNKVVVGDAWHPAAKAALEPGFSPWARVDTLTGVELVASQPYYLQFDVSPEPPVQRGFALYREHCQFCHGARHVGAAFGWDFVEAQPIARYRDSVADLYHNVAYRPRNATELGLLMPALSFLTEEDIGALRAWLEALAARDMPAYALPPKPHR
ncbi:MAG TPA: cytochrome c [Polyangia bacterium]|nr:cytochrome c [Polyangia bacterium]